LVQISSCCDCVENHAYENRSFELVDSIYIHLKTLLLNVLLISLGCNNHQIVIKVAKMVFNLF